MAFLQFVSALLLYCKQVHKLSEAGIGLLPGLNGLIVFLFEMLTVYILEKKYKPESLIITGTLLLAASFALMNIYPTIADLYLAMLIMSFSEIFTMPFMISFAVRRATEKTRGSHIGFYSLGWYIAFILTPFTSTLIISKWTYTILWWVVTAFCLITALLFYFLLRLKPKNLNQY
ncbi:MAG: MFS transporter [Chitinophagales bacterium]